MVPLGRVSATAAAVVAANLQALLGLNTLVVRPWPEPSPCLVPTRGQYDASLILRELAPEGESGALRLGLINHDLCLSFLTFVFGEAQLGGRAAVVSLHRLQDLDDGSRAPQALFLGRLAKVGLHETAHVLDLPHCRAPGCLMRFSGGLAELDRLGLEFCPACQSRLAVGRARIRRGEVRAPAGAGPGLG